MSEQRRSNKYRDDRDISDDDAAQTRAHSVKNDASPKNRKHDDDDSRNTSPLSSPDHPSKNHHHGNRAVNAVQDSRSRDNISRDNIEDTNDGNDSVGGDSNALSGHGTNSTGSGAEDDGQTPLFQVILDILNKAEKANLTASEKGSPTGTPLPSGLMDSREVGGAVKQLRSKQLLHKIAHQQETSIFAQLDHKSSRAVIIADPVASQIVWVNEAAERLFGRLDLIGSKLETLMPDELAARHAGIIASYRERYVKEFRKSGSSTDSRLLDTVKPRRLTIIRQFNGKPTEHKIDAWIRSLRMQDESHDEPSRLMALEAFEAQQYHEDAADARIFKAALDNVSDAIVVANFNGQLEYINKSAELLSGYPLAALLATRASVNVFLPPEFVAQHEGFLQHFRQGRKAAAASMTAKSHETVVSRRVEMKTAFGREEILLRVDVAYDKLIAYLKSTKEFIPREEFANERLKLLLPSSIVKLLRGATDVSDITSYFWEFDNRTVMFTDVAGFSNWAKNRPVKAVHDRMQPMFAEFEAIIQAFGGELIHRIGDAVMVIFGFNGEERHHARYALGCAVELQQWSLNNGFMIRIGLHSGSIGAGIYGSDKGRPSFDAWGPVVNIAKRLEAYGEEGNVHISKHVRDALGHRFANQLHMILRETVLEGIKGIEDGECSYILPVKAADSTQVSLPEKFLQLVGFQRAKYARWKIANEETERRLAELQKASR